MIDGPHFNVLVCGARLSLIWVHIGEKEVLTYFLDSIFLNMSEIPRETAACPNQSAESGPNYFLYYKHLVIDLLEADSIEGLSDFKRERLKAILKESAVHFNQEADEMLDYILGTIQIGANLKDEDVKLLHNNKRKAYSIGADYSNINSVATRQVYSKIQDLQQMGDTRHEAVNKYTVQLLSKLDIMEQDLDDYLNIIVSKCRPMTRREKHQLGKKIRKLPDKALDRVAEILQPGDLSSKIVPGNIAVNLEEQDNVTLWRLHYYVELVVKVNDI